jgi:hypothetical protein
MTWSARPAPDDPPAREHGSGGHKAAAEGIGLVTRQQGPGDNGVLAGHTHTDLARDLPGCPRWPGLGKCTSQRRGDLSRRPVNVTCWHLVEEPHLVIAGGDPAEQAGNALLGLIHVQATLPPLDSTEQPRRERLARVVPSSPRQRSASVLHRSLDGVRAHPPPCRGDAWHADAGTGMQHGHALDTDTRPQPDPAGLGRTHNTAADPCSCWSAAVWCWWWMVAPTGFEPALPP